MGFVASMEEAFIFGAAGPPIQPIQQKVTAKSLMLVTSWRLYGHRGRFCAVHRNRWVRRVGPSANMMHVCAQMEHTTCVSH